MAFHPLRTFQKNRRFWMAAILLMCMATFVLCTGIQGGGDFGSGYAHQHRSRRHDDRERSLRVGASRDP